MANIADRLGDVSAGIEATSDDVLELAEYEESEPIVLSDRAARFLENTVNTDIDSDRDGDRIQVRYQRDGLAVLKARQYVGVVSLPDGPTIQVTPKAAGTNLLSLLRYANDTTATTFDAPTSFEAGRTFLEALGALFQAELARVINRGLTTAYKRTEGTESHLRGQLDLQRQLQRQPPQPTQFECTYDELTHDVVPNRAILYATTLLLGMVKDRAVSRQLRSHQQTLRRRVSLTPVTAAEIDGIHLDRLAEHYSDILRLSRLVITNGFVGELSAGSSTALALLVNMNTVYEGVVEQAFTNVLADTGWEATGQEQSSDLITKGRHSATLKPDVTVKDETGTVRLVADAKWKTNSPKNADYYQLSSYMLAKDAPGLLVYPDCGRDNEAQLEIANRFQLHLAELPTAAAAPTHKDFIEIVETAVKGELQRLLPALPV